MNPISSNGVQGISDAFARAQDASSRILEAGTSGSLDQMAAAIVELKAAEMQVAASAKVVEAENEMRGRLIDILV